MKTLLAILIITMLFTWAIGSSHHLSSETFISFTFGTFSTSLLNFPGNTFCRISENAGGTISFAIFYFQIFQQLPWDCTYKRKWGSCHMISGEKKVRKASGIGKYGSVIKSLGSCITFRFSCSFTS